MLDVRNADIPLEHNVQPNQETRRFYFPGKSPGQPFKANEGRICYNITKTLGRNATIQGDRLDHFLSQADLKINYYDSMVRQTNPYNPRNMLAEFNIQVVEESQLMDMRDKMRREVGVRVDEILVIEGCESDDKVVWPRIIPCSRLIKPHMTDVCAH